MSPDDQTLDEDLIAFLADYDEALARGEPGPAGAPTPPEGQERRRRLQACLRLLRQGRTAPAAGAAPGPANRLDYPGAALGSFGRFSMRRELGRGGFGIVFLADDPHLRRPVALKVPRPEALASPDLRQRFLREARAAARLDHPNVVPVHEVGEVGEVCYIVSAYCPGEDLAAWLRRQPGPVDHFTAAALVAAVADAVAHAHGHGVFHRDLKPSNILLAPLTGPGVSAPAATACDGLDFVPRLTDFGLAKFLEPESQETTGGVIMGTPAYMAPEQAEGWGEAVGAPTDVYALGVILYELLTRRLPCQGASLLLTLEQVRSGRPVPPRHWQPGVPRDLETVCLKCLEKDAGQRYASAQALADDLRRVLRHEAIAARPPGPLTWAWGWCRRPERIRNAATVALIHGVLATTVTSLGLFLVCTGLLPTTSLAAAAAYFLALIGGFALPQLWVARRAAARSVLALWVGLFLPPLFVACQTLCFSGILPSGGVTGFGTDPSGWYAQVFTLATLDILQVSIFAAALLAYYANRHRPGFVPAIKKDTQLEHARS